MKLTRITEENLEKALNLQRTIFDNDEESFAFLEYVRQLDESSGSKCFLAEFDGEIVGVTGWYENEGDVWLNWFGIHPKFRKRGLGSKLLEKTVNEIKSLKEFLTMRVYFSNMAAEPLYSKFFSLKQEYVYEETQEKTLIYSVSLDGGKCKEWNRSLGLKWMEGYSKVGWKIINLRGWRI